MDPDQYTVDETFWAGPIWWSPGQDTETTDSDDAKESE